MCAVEKVNPKMQATLDAQILTRMNESGEINGCQVYGPLAMVTLFLCRRHCTREFKTRSRKCCILLTPDIEAGYTQQGYRVFYAGRKGRSYYGDKSSCGFDISGQLR